MTTLVKTNGNHFPAVPSVFNNLFSSDLFNWSSNHENWKTQPAVNIKESDKNYELEIAVPGMNKEDFKIELENEQLIISGEKLYDLKTENDNKYVRKEFSYQSFKRTFNLPNNVVDEKLIGASYVNGILHINLPKKEVRTDNHVKKIEIS